MIITTTGFCPGKEIEEYLGLVQGSTIRSKHLGKDFMAGLKSIFGGELGGYTEMMNEARAQAIDRMIAEAEDLGADAIVGMRLTTAAVVSGAAEVLAYGTAVRLKG